MNLPIREKVELESKKTQCSKIRRKKTANFDYLISYVYPGTLPELGT